MFYCGPHGLHGLHGPHFTRTPGTMDDQGEDRDFDRSRRRKKKPGRKDKDWVEEDSKPTGTNSGSTSATKHPIILAKPNSEWPTPSRTTDAPLSASPTHSISSPIPASPAAESKPIVMLRQREEGRGNSPAQTIPSLLAGEGQLPQAPPQYLMQRKSSSSSGPVLTDVGGPGKLANPPEMIQAIKLVDESLGWCDSGMDILLDQTDFLTIGILGLQGVGKSTILSALGGSKHTQKTLVFRPESKEARDVGRHQTNGLDMYVTNERIILLDAQPILSASLVDQMVHNDRKYPPEYNSVENYVEMQSLQIATFMMTVCNVVIVALDWFADLSLLKFLLTAEMLKPPKPSSGHEGNVSEESQEYYPHIVFVLNRAAREDFGSESQRSMHNIIGQVLEQSKLKFRGGINGNSSGKKNKNFSSDVNLLLLPSFPSATKDNGIRIPTDYEGIPSYEHQIKKLRNHIFAIPRIPLTHTTLSEKNWFHYAARTWDAVKKSQLLAEYNRLLS